MIAYLENCKVFPESYSASAGWYKGEYTVQMGEQISQIVLEHLRLYYIELLSDYPDVLTTQVVSEITGYGKTSINNWCNQGHIKSFRKNNVNHIPKVYLVEFFCSLPTSALSLQITVAHPYSLQGFSSWRKIRDLHTAEIEGGAE
ncbi:MAG: helix-turn-helix domain-containing protein [[Clostridium] leptum]